MTEPPVWQKMAAILEESANLCLDDIPDDPVRKANRSAADQETDLFVEQLGSDAPALWISELTGVYLAEAAHELRSLALLLRNENVTGSIEVLVRAVVERVGRINWVLDPGDQVTPMVRAIRASFETAVSLQHYRRAVEDLGVKGSAAQRRVTAVRDQRRQIEAWFADIERPPTDPSDPSSSPTADVSKWVICGERYPTYEKLARWALADDGLSDRVTRGTYGALSSFSHPSFVAGREHRSVQGKQVTYTYEFSYVERLLRIALFGFGDSLKRWLSYYDCDDDRLVSRLDDIAAQWDGLRSGRVPGSAATRP